MSILVSVVVPLYNKANTIRLTLDSVRQQVYQNLEIIVVDDGSTDQSVSFVTQIKDSRLRIISQKNGGQSAARNQGIYAARGECIAFLDADDIWEIDHIQKLVELMDKYPTAGLFATAYRSVYRGGYSLETKAIAQNGKDFDFIVDDYFSLASVAPIVWVSATAVPKRVFSDVGYFLEGEHRGADREMWARIALRYDVAYCRCARATYNCVAENRESNKTRQLQFPPAIALLDSQNHNQLSSNVKNSISLYKHTLIIGYLAKALLAGERGEMVSTQRMIHPTNISETLQKLWWNTLILLPLVISRFIVKLIGSRYLSLWSYPSKHRRGVEVTRVESSERLVARLRGV